MRNGETLSVPVNLSKQQADEILQQSGKVESIGSRVSEKKRLKQERQQTRKRRQGRAPR